MARSAVHLIHVRPRMMRVGHQFYPLAQISRVQNTYFDVKNPFSGGHVLLALVAGALFVAGVVASASGSRSAGTSGAGGVLCVLALVGLVAVLIHGSSSRTRYYAVVIETSGNQSTQLSGPVEHEITALTHAVVDAIENPPTSERVIQVGDNVFVNNSAGVQVGNGNNQGDVIAGTRR